MKQGQYNRVDSELTTHHAFRALSERAKLLCLFVRANRNNNALGCFYYPLSHICDDLDTPLQGASKGLVELEKDGFILYCKTTRWLLLPKHLKKFPIFGVNRMKNAIKLFEDVPKDFKYIIKLYDLLSSYHDLQDEADKPLGRDLEGAWEGVRRGLEAPPDYTDTDTTTNTYTDAPNPAEPDGSEGIHFEEFWEVWPTGKKKGKPKALEYWKRDKLDLIKEMIITDVVHRKAKDDHWVRGYVPYPQKYLNNQGWEDDIDEKGTRTGRPGENQSAADEAREFAGKGITIDQ